MSSSARTRSGPLSSGRPVPLVSSGRSPRSSASWVGCWSAVRTGSAAWDCAAARPAPAHPRGSGPTRQGAAPPLAGAAPPAARNGPAPGRSGRARPRAAAGHDGWSGRGAQSAGADAGRGHPHAVEAVEPAGEDEAFGDGAGDVGAVPEVGQPGVGLPGDDARHLGLVDAPDVGQGQPDAVVAGIGQVGVRRDEPAPPSAPVQDRGAGVAVATASTRSMR